MIIVIVGNKIDDEESADNGAHDVEEVTEMIVRTIEFPNTRGQMEGKITLMGIFLIILKTEMGKT